MGYLLNGSMVGLIETLLKSAYVWPSSAAARAPVPVAGHCWTPTSTGDIQTLKGRSGLVSVCSLGPGVHKALFELSECLWQVWGLILNMISPLLPSCWVFSFAFGCGVSFFWWDQTPVILLLMVVQQWVAVLEFCKEIEENNRIGKNRDLFKKIRDTKRTFLAKMGTIKDRNGMT